MKTLLRSLLWVSLYAVAMGFLESAVVVYLRALYYPAGFGFPLAAMDPGLAVTELLREAATLLMLVSVALIASRRFAEALAWFLYAFAIWDIVYYGFLWLLIGWPSSLSVWDLLFLIPVLWTGPVYAPILNSLTMILLAISILLAAKRQERIRINGVEWILLLTGVAFTLAAYTGDYIAFMRKEFDLATLLSFSRYPEVLHYSSAYVPAHFPVLPFLAGEAFFLTAILLFRKRNLGPGEGFRGTCRIHPHLRTPI